MNTHFNWYKFCGEAILNISCDFDRNILRWTWNVKWLGIIDNF